jgi:hypothetical protein
VTDRIALGLGLVIVLAVGADLALGLGASLFLATRFLELLDWLAIWR